MSDYDPEYTSIDYASQYIRAKNNIQITDVVEKTSDIEITVTGNNDMKTKCMIFSEENYQIISRYIEIPQINGLIVISAAK